MVDFANPPAPGSAPTDRRPPAPPKTCTREACSRPVFLLAAVVDVAAGFTQLPERKSGVLADFTMPDGNLKPGVTWVGWVGRCTDCYDLEHAPPLHPEVSRG